KAKPCAPSTNLFLHADDVAEVQRQIALSLPWVCCNLAKIFPEIAYAAGANNGQRGAGHNLGVSPDGGGNDLRIVDGFGYMLGKIEHAFCCQSPFGESCLLQILAVADHGLFKDRIADLVLVASAPNNEKVVGIEMKAHFIGEVRQAIDTGRSEGTRLDDRHGKNKY